MPFFNSLYSAGSSTCGVSWARLSSLAQFLHPSGFTSSLTCEVGDISIDRVTVETIGSPAGSSSITTEGSAIVASPMTGNPAPGVTLPGVGGTSWTCASNWFTSSSSCCWLSCARLILLLWTKEKMAFILGNRSSDLRVFSEGMSK